MKRLSEILRQKLKETIVVESDKVPEGTRQTSVLNPVIGVYQDGHFTAGLNLTVFMSIHRVSVKYQEELANKVWEAGYGNSVKLPSYMFKQYYKDIDDEYAETGRENIERTQEFKIELADWEENKAVDPNLSESNVKSHITENEDEDSIKQAVEILKTGVATFIEYGDFEPNDIKMWAKDTMDFAEESYEYFDFFDELEFMDFLEFVVDNAKLISDEFKKSGV